LRKDVGALLSLLDHWVTSGAGDKQRQFEYRAEALEARGKRGISGHTYALLTSSTVAINFNLQGLSVERKRHRDDEHLDPGHDAAHYGKGTADGLASGENRPNSGRSEDLLGSLPLVLTVRTATQEPVRVLPDPRDDWEEWKALLSESGINKNARLHEARHTCGTLLGEQHMDMHVIQRILGHAQVSTTRIYTDPTDPLTREAVDRIGRVLLSSDGRAGRPGSSGRRRRRRPCS
jgi:hypothetical protein